MLHALGNQERVGGYSLLPLYRTMCFDKSDNQEDQWMTLLYVTGSIFLLKMHKFLGISVGVRQ